MFVLLDTNGNLLRPTPEASTAYNSYWYPGTAGTSGDFDFGSDARHGLPALPANAKFPMPLHRQITIFPTAY